MSQLTKGEILSYLRSLPNERTRTYEGKITSFAVSHQDEASVAIFHEIMDEDTDVSYEAFFCLETICRRNRDYSDLAALIEKARKNDAFVKRVSFKHICIMYHVHSETLYDYDNLLTMAHESACEMYENSGYQHTFANTFATIMEKCLPSDGEKIAQKWYDTALFCVNRAISLEPAYAKFLSTKARIVSFKGHYEEANELLRRAIDLENSKKADYALLIGNYQYYRTMIALRKQQEACTAPASPLREKYRTEQDGGSFDGKNPFAFVSYSHVDCEQVFPIIDKLRSMGGNIWYDDALEGGSDWAEVIGTQITQCSLMLLMLTHSSILSANVRNEITMAQNRGKIIVPIFLEDVYLSEGAELQLQRHHWIKKFSLSSDVFYQKVFRILQKSQACTQPAAPLSAQAPAVEKTAVTPTFQSFTCSKSGGSEDNEDLIYTDDHFYAVFDGATSKNDSKWNNRTGGRITVELLADYMRSEHFDPNIDGKTAISLLRSELIRYAKEHDLEQKGVHLCASAVIYSKAKRQIWSVGDCQYRINGTVHAPQKKIDEVFSNLRSVLIHALLMEGKTEEELLEKDEARAMILDLMRKQRLFENTAEEYGYSVLSCRGGVPQAEIVDVPPGAEVVLASDGYPVLESSLEETENKLRELIQKDPLCYNELRSTKGIARGNVSFDDRSYLRFSAE